MFRERRLAYRQAMQNTMSEPFPAFGIIPKTETQASAFIQKYPSFDGRGVVVAIFDTGIDPGAKGLQTTTEGLPKVVDIVDATGSGDVNMSKTIELQDDATAIVGLTGRTLTFPAEWKCPSGKWHLGRKALWDLFPGSLVNRLKKERRREWDEEFRKVHTSLVHEIMGWEQQHPLPRSDVDKQTHEDMKERLDIHQQLADKLEDVGPVVDCVVFHDGSHWCAAVDKSEKGDFSSATLLRDYRIAQEYDHFGPGDLMAYSINWNRSS